MHREGSDGASPVARARTRASAATEGRPASGFTRLPLTLNLIAGVDLR